MARGQVGAHSSPALRADGRGCVGPVGGLPVGGGQLGCEPAGAARQGQLHRVAEPVAAVGAHHQPVDYHFEAGVLRGRQLIRERGQINQFAVQPRPHESLPQQPAQLLAQVLPRIRLDGRGQHQPGPGRRPGQIVGHLG